MIADATERDGTLHVTDSRTGRRYQLPITDGAVRAVDPRQIKVSADDFGLVSRLIAKMPTLAAASACGWRPWRRRQFRGAPARRALRRACERMIPAGRLGSCTG